MYTQLIPFNQSTAGKVVGFCLQNVRSGYGIPAKYPNAITAWGHTQQHKDRNIPTGVATPLFYTYGTDGHINVQLPNGQVWSDGSLYASLSDYESKHSAVSYLGWGESVNDVAVIKQGDTMPPDYKVNKGDVINVCASYGWTPDQNYINAWVGQSWKAFWYDVSSQPKSKPSTTVLAPGTYKVN